MADAKGDVREIQRRRRWKWATGLLRASFAVAVVATMAVGCLHPRVPPLPILQQHPERDGRMEA